MNLKHNLETPLMTIKTVLSILEANGAVDERMKRNCNQSFKRINQAINEIDIVHTYLEGVYRLVDFKLNGDVWGSNPVGRLIYKDGCMSVSISCDSRLNTSSNSENCHLFYSGRYEVDFVKSEVKHFVDIASSKNRIGKTETIKYKIENDLLWLEAQGEYGSADLLWRKEI